MERKTLVQQSDKGEIAVFDGRDDFIAAFKDGKWIADLGFNSYELEEFNLILDEIESARILTEARAALNRPLPTK
jgi:hypothetical protein